MKQESLNGTHHNGSTPHDRLSTAPFPASRKVYVEGTHPGVRVPMREITLTPPHAPQDQSPEPVSETTPSSIAVYDTSGVYTDPAVSIDIRQGLAPVRQDWIVARGDSEELEGQLFGLRPLPCCRSFPYRNSISSPPAPATRPGRPKRVPNALCA